MSVQVLWALAGLSGGTGLLALILYVYWLLQSNINKDTFRSLADKISGLGLEPKQIMTIILSFKSEDARIRALETVFRETRKAHGDPKLIYGVLKPDIDILDHERAARTGRLWSSGIAAIVLIVLAAIVASLIYARALPCCDPPEAQLTLRNAVSFEAQHAEGVVGRRTVSRLVPTSASYAIGTNTDPMFPLGFVIEGARISPGNIANLLIVARGLRTNPQPGGAPILDPPAWTRSVPLGSADAWKRFSIPRRITPEAVARALSAETSGMPVALILECLAPAELAEWSGDIDVRVEDRNGPLRTASLDPGFSLILGRAPAANVAPAPLSQTDVRRECPSP